MLDRLSAWVILLGACSGAVAAGEMQSVVVDGSGAPVAGVRVIVQSAQGTPVASAYANLSGEFMVRQLPKGKYLLRVIAAGFEPVELAFEVGKGEPLPGRIELSLARIHSQVTVTATRGAVEEVTATPQVVNIADHEQLSQRPLATVGNALEYKPGVLVQQTTYGQVSPILRGLTGYHVLNLVDGVRFNNSTFRSGPNQYLAFVEPSQTDQIEAILGPSSTQYGSDSLGGSINVVTPTPPLSLDGRLETHGELSVFAASADASGGVHAQVTVGTPRISWLGGGTWRRHNDLRAGRGEDSRNVFVRLFGLSQGEVKNLVGSRLQDTGFSQYGAHSKLLVRPAEDQSLTVSYQHSTLDGVRGYRDLLGGRGWLQSSFEPQALNFFYGRYEKLGLGSLDSLSATLSVNSQRDGQVRQSYRYSDPIEREWNRVDALGYSLQAGAHAGSRSALLFGGDVYDERIGSERLVEDSVTGSGARTRPLYPDGSRYRTAGLFGQGTLELLPGKVRLGLGGRYTGVSFHSPADTRFGVIESSRRFGDFTFNSAVSFDVKRNASLYLLVGRGVRAPNANDLGAVGWNSFGYEVPAEEAIAAGALLSTDAGEGATSKGTAVRKLSPETLYNHEVGFKVSARRFYARVHGFGAALHDPIVRRTLLFPARNPPSTLGGLPVTPNPPTREQQAQGVVSVGNQTDPRSVKAFVNDGRSRYYGIESLVRFVVSSRWSLEGNYTFLVGRELDPNRAATRLPPQFAYIGARHSASGRRPWLAVGVRIAGVQSRLSGADISDLRIGAARSRRDIADFFNGSRVRAYLDPQRGIFLPTGETLRQIQDRVLPLGETINGVTVDSDRIPVPLRLQTDGWFAVDAHGGFPLTERISLAFSVVNVFDANYRVHGSGVDGVGLNVYTSLRYVF